MKATFLTSVLVALSFTANVNANNVNTYSNIEATESGTKKEYISVNKESLKPLTKSFYNYDSDGRILEKTFSKWSYEKGWEVTGRYEYIYNDVSKVASIIYTDTNGTDAKERLLVYLYDENDEFLSIEQIEINDVNSNVFTLK